MDWIGNLAWSALREGTGASIGTGRHQIGLVLGCMSGDRRAGEPE